MAISLMRAAIGSHVDEENSARSFQRVNHFFRGENNRIGLAHHRLEIEQSPCALLFWAEKGSTSRLLRRNRDLFSPLSGSRRAVSLLNLHFVIPVQR